MTPSFAPRRLSALAIAAGVFGAGMSPFADAATVPDATITAPAGNDTFQRTGPITFRGAVQGAVAVRVAVQDRAGKLWWRSDGTWGDRQFQPAEISNGSWFFSWTPPSAGDYLVQVFAQDAAGVVDPTPPFARFSALDLPDRAAPAAAVGSPAQNEVVRAGTALTARGLAADDTGVASVGVAIQDRATKLWWRSDGTWGAFERHPATLDAPGARQTGWTLTWTPPADGNFAFQVATKDTGGTTDPDLPFRSFSADGGAPDAAVGGAQDLAYPAGKVITWSGTATDARGVTDVYAAVQDRATKQWWHADGTWGAFARFPVTLTGPVDGAPWSVNGGRWSFTRTGWRFTWVPPRTGDFGLQVTAVDGAGLADPSLPWVRFSAAPAPADTTAPQAAFTAPRAGRTLTGAPVRITGTATDDTAITAVYVAVMNRDTGQWWQPGGGWGAYRRLVPAVTGKGTGSAAWAYDWTPPADGRYLVHVEAFDAAGNVASAPAGGRPGMAFGLHRGAVAYTTLLLSRSQWAAVDSGCTPMRGAVTLDEVAAELDRRGIRATGTVVGNRTGDATRACQPGFTSYATWADLARLRDADGFTFVSHGATYADMTALTPDGQRAESCGSLAALEAHGHTRAWGLFAYPNDKHTTGIQQDVVSTCFAYARRYGSGVNTPSSTAAPYFQSTLSWPSGRCDDPALTCSSWVGGGDGTRYTSPDTLAVAMAGGEGEWNVVQGYKFLRGRRIAASGPQWDCTSADWRAHWTSAAESYCLSDLLTALDRTHGATFTDPASVAEAWGRAPQTVRKSRPAR